MPKQNKPVQDNNELPKKPTETKEAKQRRRRTNAIITASAILAFIIIVAGGGWYWVYQVPLKAPVFTESHSHELLRADRYHEYDSKHYR
jgi:uncharacterized protein HemX